MRNSPNELKERWYGTAPKNAKRDLAVWSRAGNKVLDAITSILQEVNGE